MFLGTERTNQVQSVIGQYHHTNELVTNAWHDHNPVPSLCFATKNLNQNKSKSVVTGKSSGKEVDQQSLYKPHYSSEEMFASKEMQTSASNGQQVVLPGDADILCGKR